MARFRVAVAVTAPWLWAGGVLLLSRSAPAMAAVPSLGVVRGPLGLVLLGLAASVSAAPFVGKLFPRLGGWPPPALFLACVLVYGVFGLRHVGGLTASGDEPHYLLMAQSLWKEGDLELRDNVARGDYRDYFPGTLSPHWGSPRVDGRPFPAHSPGLPLLLAPVYALGGRAACVGLFALLAAALVREVRALAFRATGDPTSALLAAVAVAGPPVFYYAFHLYTELPSALALALSLRILTGAPGISGAVGAALATSFLPWLHLKMIPAAAVLGVIAVLRLRGRSRAAFVVVAALAAIAFAGYYQWVFGMPTPLAVYGGGVPPDSATSPVRAAAGLLLDRSFGLLPHAPVFLLALAGLPLLLRRAVREALPHLGIVIVGAAVLAPIVEWRMWWGGQCPPGRFLVPLVPCLGVAVAARLRGSSRGLAHWRWPLLSSGAALAVFMAARPAALLMLNRGDRPTRVWAALSGETPVERYLPSLVGNDLADQRATIVWVCVVVLVLALDAWAQRREAVDNALFRGLGLPVTLLLAAGITLDGWAFGVGPAAEGASAPRLSSKDGAASAPCPLRPRRDRRA